MRCSKYKRKTGASGFVKLNDMKNFVEKLNWKVMLGVTFVALIGLIIAPVESVWNAVAGIPLFLCGAYWLYLLFQND